MKIISTIESNKVLKIGLMVTLILLVLMVSIIVSGHFVIGNIVQEESKTINLSDPVTQKRYNRLMLDYSNLKEERESLKLIRTPKDSVVLLVQYFEEIALKLGVKQTVAVVTADENKSKKEYTIPTVRYEINVVGGFSAIGGYLASLKQAPFFLRIESFDVVAPNDNSPTGDYLATIFVAVAIKE